MGVLLIQKYKSLVDFAKQNDVNDLHIAEIDGVLHVVGTVVSPEIKNALWDIYNQLDPNFVSKDLNLRIKTSDTTPAKTAQCKVSDSSKLRLHEGPDADLPIVGKLSAESTLKILSRAKNNWWLVRMEDSTEGYGYIDEVDPLG